MRRTWFFIGIGATLIVGMLLSYVLCVGVLPGTYRGAMAPRTHSEAVKQVLDRHAVPYTDIQIVDSCPPMPQCWAAGPDDDSAYAAEVVVAGVQAGSGRIACRHRQSDCVLTLAALGLYGVPLPPLAQNQPWLETLKRQMQAMEAWFRTWTARLQHQ